MAVGVPGVRAFAREGWHVGGPQSSSRRAIASLRSDQFRCASVMLSNKVSVSGSGALLQDRQVACGDIRHRPSSWQRVA
jgi:hypothetical protein